MADILRSIRDLFLQGVEVVNNAATHVANATRSKVDELNLRNQRKELVEKLANDLAEQWRLGLELPTVLIGTLEQIRDIDAQLAEAAAQPEPCAEEPAAPEADPQPGANPQPEAPAPTIVVEEEVPAAPEAPAMPEKPDVSEVPTLQVDEPKEEE